MRRRFAVRTCGWAIQDAIHVSRRHWVTLHPPHDVAGANSSWRARFNPAYGQGMSAAAGQCRALEAILDRRRAAGESIAGLATEFLPVADEWVRGPWATAATLDFQHPSCTGDFPTDELDDLEKVMRLTRSVQTHPELRALLLDVNVLRVPLAAIRDVSFAPDGPSSP